ncbi:MAG: cyclic nucleotide-binding domain-containing protein [Elainellaceae cyanobacterium]
MTEILLRELSNADLDWMVGTGEQQQVAAGDRLSPSPAHIYCLLDGALEPAERAPEHGAVQQPFGPGDILGSEALLDLPFAAADLKAVENTTVLALSQQMVQAKLQDDPSFAARVYRVLALVLSQRLRHLYEQSAALRQGHQREMQEALMVLGELRDSDIDWLTVAGRVRAIAPGDFLLQAGRPIDALYLVLEGTFSVLWLEGDANPLKVCFDCPIETAGQMRQIATLTKGEMAGISAFLDARPLAVSIRADDEALVLSVPRQTVTARLLQDAGFSTRFYRVLAIQMAKLLQDAIGLEVEAAAAAAPGPLDADALDDDELDLDALQNASQGAARFNWMLQRLGVG